MERFRYYGTSLAAAVSCMKARIAFVALFTVVWLACARASSAQDYPRNAWGLMASPMSSTLTGHDLSNYELGASDMSLGLGAFYQHVFAPRVSGRFELSARQNYYGTYAQVAPLATAWCSALETTIETVVVVSIDRHVDLAGHDARFSLGTGPVVSAVIEQTI